MHQQKAFQPRAGRSVEPPTLRGRNEQHVLEIVQQHGPLARPELTRVSGLTHPTVAKAVETLLQRGLIDEIEPVSAKVGRPSRLVRMATKKAAVLGVVIDAERSCVVASGLDGQIHEERTRWFSTPETYAALLDAVECHCHELVNARGVRVHGVGISVPGLVNDRLRKIVFSPNVHMLDGHNPADDLKRRLRMNCLMVQETKALCLGERLYGAGLGIREFALLDVSTGMALGVVSDGRMLAGHSGMAGEIGHFTAVPDGIRCGCGNAGCMETVATDTALIRLMSAGTGRQLGRDEAVALLRQKPDRWRAELDEVTAYLAIAIAGVINIFNPAILFVHSGLLLSTTDQQTRLRELVSRRGLGAAVGDCDIRLTRSNKPQAAVAAVIHQLIHDWPQELQ